MKKLASALVIIAGMIGLYFKVDLSGWVLAAGIITLFRL